ncbi:hypothetical protein [Streptomyces sp. NPDC002133]
MHRRILSDPRAVVSNGPTGLEVLDAFPMTVSGKVRKVELRETYAR